MTAQNLRHFSSYFAEGETIKSKKVSNRILHTSSVYMLKVFQWEKAVIFNHEVELFSVLTEGIEQKLHKRHLSYLQGQMKTTMFHRAHSFLR